MSNKVNNTDLVIQKAANKLSKEQQQFNTLVKKITNKEQEIAAYKAKIVELNTLYQKKVMPLKIQLGEQKFALAEQMADALEKVKFPKNKQNSVKEVISDLCTDLFQVVEPTSEQIAFYDKFSETTFEEEEKENEDLLFSMMNMMLKSAGVNMDLNEYDKTEAGRQKLQSDFFEKTAAMNQGAATEGKKKSKKELAAAIAQKQLEETRHKSLRSIYINLAKLLHPDMETNDQLKLEKEEYMKQVAVAYEQKDLIALLRMENQWIHRHTSQLQNVGVDTLKTYLFFLKQRYQDLEEELFDMLNNLETEDIDYLLPMTIENANKRMQKDMVKPLKQTIEFINAQMNALHDTDDARVKKIILKIVEWHLPYNWEF